MPFNKATLQDLSTPYYLQSYTKKDDISQVTKVKGDKLILAFHEYDKDKLLNKYRAEKDIYY